jgi:predicted DNA-binding protein
VKTKVIGVRLDLEDARRLEEIAKTQGLKIGELLRQIIVQYLDNQQDVSSDNEPQVKDIVERTTKTLEGIVNYYIKYCEDYAKELVSLHPNENYEYWYKDCLKRRRGMIREKMIGLIRNADLEISKIITNYDKRAQYLRNMYQSMEIYLSRLP